MQHHILLKWNQCSKINNIKISQLKRLVESGIVQIEKLGLLQLPVSRVMFYMFLKKNLEMRKKDLVNDEYVVEVIDEILTKESALKSVKDEQIVEVVCLLEEEIIEGISDLYSFICKRYAVWSKVHERGKQSDAVLIEQKNRYGIGNVVKLCLKYIKNFKELKLSNDKVLDIIEKTILPFYFQSQGKQFQHLYQQIEEIIKKLLIVSKEESFQHKISTLFSRIYISFWKDISPNFDSTSQVKLLQRQFSMLELVHFNIPYCPDLVTSELLKKHIKTLLMFRGENKSTIHHAAIDVYNKLAKQLNQQNSNTKTFSNIFLILNSYGVHLIKDVWPSFYILLQSSDSSVYSWVQLVELILWKLQTHQNNNVIKHCLHSLLENVNSHYLFQKSPEIVYKRIVPMFNLGVNYQDCKFHNDSKIYKVIQSFFVQFYEKEYLSVKILQKHLSQLLDSILAFQNYDHASIALIMVFQQQTKKTTFVDRPTLQKITNLVKNGYSRFPMRKRYQLMDSIISLLLNNVNHEQIPLKLILNFVTLINKQYLIDVNLFNIAKLIESYGKEQIQFWIKEQTDEIMLEIKININNQKKNYDLFPLLNRIKTVQVCSEILPVNIENYIQYWKDMILEFGVSTYKTIKQRFFVISAYYHLHSSILPKMNYKNKFGQHLEAVLNLIAMFAMMQTSEKQELFKEQANIQDKISQIAYQLFIKAYTFEKGEQFSEREEERVIVARMMEWAQDHIQQNIALNIILVDLRARVSVLQQKMKRRDIFSGDQNLFQQTLYELFTKIQALQESNWQAKNQLSFLSKDKQLRLRVLLSSILVHDPRHKISQNPPTCPELADIIDRYDFQKYPQICWLIENIYCRQIIPQNEENMLPRFEDDQGKMLAIQIELILQNIMHSLQYSLQKKQILPLCETAVNILFSFICVTNKVNKSMVDLCIKLINIGQNYLIFQRTIALAVADGFVKYFQVISEGQYEHIIPLITRIVSIQQYRGFDSAVSCYSQNKCYQFYQKQGYNFERSYSGAVPRFVFMTVFKDAIAQFKTSKCALNLFRDLIQQCVDICLQVGRQRMFLTGQNKVKLQMWQFLLLFDVETIFLSLKQQNYNYFILKLIQSLNLTQINEVRYYSQLFLMKLLLQKQLFQKITPHVLNSLIQGLSNSSGNVNKSVIYLVTSGILIKHILSMSQSHQNHFLTIKQHFLKLYNTILIFVGSSVSYFRGLSQYFCLQTFSGYLETKYTSILRQNYLMDADAKILKEKLTFVIEGYISEIHKWKIDEQILSKIPNQNGNVTCDHYYLDRLKSLGSELAKIGKNQDGYIAYRNIWKENVEKQQGSKDEEDQEQGQQQKKDEEDADVFQRKIDMIGDLTNINTSTSHLKILVTSAKSEVLIGHLARTGQIFGIEELIIPNIKTISLDSFKSISVTAQRWLNITDLGGSSQPQQINKSILKTLIQNKSNGYQLIKLFKNKFRSKTLNRCPKMNEKCLLILDEEQILSGINFDLIDGELQLGKYFSLHVQASIVIWQYFKTYLGK